MVVLIIEKFYTLKVYLSGEIVFPFSNKFQNTYLHKICRCESDESPPGRDKWLPYNYNLTLKCLWNEN